MDIPCLSSINRIKRRYHTGEEPVLVECNDRHSYICKYMRSSSSAFKLACELVGTILAKIWGINIPEPAFVRIKRIDWPHYGSINFSAPSFGTRIIPEAIDITAVSYAKIKESDSLRRQLILIALFDIWIGNEDRNFHNSNLLYNLQSHNLIAIDHGCIFNTATFDYNLSLLTSNETILQSDLAYHIFKGIFLDQLVSMIEELRIHYGKSVSLSREACNSIVGQLPSEWNVPADMVVRKLTQLFDPVWEENCWNAFLEMIRDCKYVQN